MTHALRILQLVLLALIARHSAAMAPQDVPAPGTSGGIATIMVERTWCFGRCPIDILVLRADGSAEYTGKQNVARVGRFTGTFGSREFDKLAQWLVAEGFLQLQGLYGRPNIDGDSEVIRVTRGGGESNTVINHSDQHSPQVLSMGEFIRTAVASIAWQPGNSGIRGTALAPNQSLYITPREQQSTRSMESDEYVIRTNEQGNFEIPLAVGTYDVVAVNQGQPQTFVVEPGRFAETSTRFSTRIREAPVR